jgi:ribA/ribD-fused uncharacterized protein
MKYSTQQLIDQQAKGAHLDFLFFWGHQQKKDGSISKSCFSQWWVAPFVQDGIEYKTAEHFMMAGKAKLFGDEEIHSLIIQSDTPKKAKALGRKVSDFDFTKWEENKIEIVMQANKLKFSQNEALKEFLINSKPKILVEASPVDPIWGNGMAEDNPNIYNPKMWKGENLLGYLLMEIRDEI